MDRKIIWTVNALLHRARGMKVGMPSYIGPTVYVSPRRAIRIGKRVRIWPGLRIEAYNDAKIAIEDDVVIGQFCHIIAAEDLTISSGCVFAGMNFISNVNHAVREMEKGVFDRPWDIRSTKIGKRVFCGLGAKLLPGTELADNCVVGANAVVSALKVEEQSIIVGVPAKVVRKIVE
jgi:acetyltransferase-like isoleucine patch superfamily enzyme